MRVSSAAAFALNDQGAAGHAVPDLRGLGGRIDYVGGVMHEPSVVVRREARDGLGFLLHGGHVRVVGVGVRLGVGVGAHLARRHRALAARHVVERAALVRHQHAAGQFVVDVLQALCVLRSRPEGRFALQPHEAQIGRAVGIGLVRIPVQDLLGLFGVLVRRVVGRDLAPVLRRSERLAAEFLQPARLVAAERTRLNVEVD